MPVKFVCRECGRPQEARRASREFCGVACRRAFNNRRASRGADFYDVVMALRFERERAEAAGAWSFLCRMAASFRVVDERERAGRRSWEDFATVRRRNAHLDATVVGVGVAGGRRLARRTAAASGQEVPARVCRGV